MDEQKAEHQERTSVLANERTYAAWIRTGLSTFATGLGAEALLGGVIPSAFIRATSMVMFLCSGCFFFLAAWRYQHVGKRLKTEKVYGASVALLFALSILLILIVLLAFFGVWIVNR